MKSMNAQEKLIEAAYELMLTRGYSSTSVDDLCREAEVSKGSFYHFFSSKEELGLALLDDFFEKSRELIFAGRYVDEPDPLKRLIMLLRQTEASAPTLWRQGCLLGTFASELSETHPLVRQKVSDILRKVVDTWAEHLEPLSDMHPQNELLQPRRLAEFYVSIIEGSIILSRAHADPGYMLRAMQGFRSYVESMID